MKAQVQSKAITWYLIALVSQLMMELATAVRNNKRLVGGRLEAFENFGNCLWKAFAVFLQISIALQTEWMIDIVSGVNEFGTVICNKRVTVIHAEPTMLPVTASENVFNKTNQVRSRQVVLLKFHLFSVPCLAI